MSRGSRRKTKLSKSMSVTDFDNGYWYATEIKSFAKEIKIAGVSNLRKDELEELIKHYLRSGKVKRSTNKRPRVSGRKDSDRGLKLSLPVGVYTNNKETKSFIVREAKKIAPDFKEKSGSRYRLNRWREEQIERGVKITYGDLVRRFVELCQTDGRFPQARSGRYVNFLSDYFSGEKGANRDEAIKAWKTLKGLDIPKTYSAWKKFHLAK
ncbi:MAG: SAP domain-containing protein [Gammaproteobacteria bacterium]|nr:SAP domain-containing protein [Gammaproteobacteria bacterium]